MNHRRIISMNKKLWTLVINLMTLLFNKVKYEYCKKISIIILIFSVLLGIISIVGDLQTKVKCIDHGVWEILQNEYGWDSDGDGVEVHGGTEIRKSIEEYSAAKQKYYGVKPSTGTNNNTSNSSSKTSTPACEHDYVAEVTTPATCIAEGVTTYTCSKCGDTYTEAIPIDANAHEFGEPVTADATCTEVGTITKTCNLCGTSEVEEIPALGHDYKEAVTTEPTCTGLGVKTFTCSRCGDTYTEDIPALGHVESDWIIDKEASLFFTGGKHKICTRCNETLITEVIPSRYPTWYLYALIGIGVVIVGIIIGIVIKKHNNSDDDNTIDEQKALDMLKNA